MCIQEIDSRNSIKKLSSLQGKALIHKALTTNEVKINEDEAMNR